MQTKISLKWPLLAVGIGGIVFSSIIALFATLGTSVQGSYMKASPTGSQAPQNLSSSKPVESIQNSVPEEPASAGLPTRLKIPTINVDAALESVGLTRKGAVGVPKIPANAAWFSLGPRPGDNGSAVITGHYGTWQNGQGSVFDDLNNVKVGDKLYVEDEQGATTTFVVRELRTYGQNEDAPEVFSSRDGKAHLNLITCEGTWDNTQKTYSNRLVVFTDRIIES